MTFSFFSERVRESPLPGQFQQSIPLSLPLLRIGPDRGASTSKAGRVHKEVTRKLTENRQQRKECNGGVSNKLPGECQPQKNFAG
jgi:hypothetical protein